MSKEAWTDADEENPWLVARIGEVIAASDLIERNVTGALNSNLKFMQGLADGGDASVTSQDLLAQVWAQEPAIRADTVEWLGSYLFLAYQPLNEQDLADYVAFWETRSGKALNRAMFAAFNEVYDGISYATARVLALHFGAEEL